jgi:hypothetical protein
MLTSYRYMNSCLLSFVSVLLSAILLYHFVCSVADLSPFCPFARKSRTWLPCDHVHTVFTLLYFGHYLFIYLIIYLFIYVFVDYS